jgi:arylsulfatase A-like enzyme
MPVSAKGLHPNEITIAEVLKSRGYATAIIGKWHLGDQLPFLPARQGFDYWFGIPYSDDMTARNGRPPLPLMENERVIEAPPDRNLLTKRYTEKVIEFVTEHKDDPFFVYMPQAMPGSTGTSFASDRFRGKSANGTYGDTIEELDWSAGQIVETLKKLNIHERTLVIWSSDNGAWQPLKRGSNAPLAGWLGSTLEGAMRVPCVMWWPGRIPAGKECGELITSMDFLPTFARLAGAQTSSDRIIDGHDIRPLLSGGTNARSPYDAFFYYCKGQLQAVRSGKWKLYLPLKEKLLDYRGKKANSSVVLHDLDNDIGETTNVADHHPDVVKRLTALAEKAREDLGDFRKPGKNQRPAGMVQNPTPRVLEQ